MTPRAVSKDQQLFFRRVLKYKDGKTQHVNEEVKRVANGMTREGIKEFTLKKNK